MACRREKEEQAGGPRIMPSGAGVCSTSKSSPLTSPAGITVRDFRPLASEDYKKTGPWFTPPRNPRASGRVQKERCGK